MRHQLLFAAAFVAVLGAAAGPAGADHKYGWTISESESDPLANSGSASNALETLYLWYYCSEGDGMAAAEFDIEAQGISLIGTNPVNGFLNAAGGSELLLAVGGCPEGPMVAAELVVINVPGTLCIVPSLDNNRHVTVDCSNQPYTWNIDWVGYSSLGAAPCNGGALCNATLEASTWAGVKGMYRNQ